MSVCAEMRGTRAAQLTWDAIEARLRAGLRPVVTVGAAAKEHGRHLPIDTDLRQANWLGSAIASRWPALAWPALGYGHYPAFLAYPGSTSVAASTFSATIRDILQCIAPYQTVPTVVVNTGISTIAPLEQLNEQLEGSFELAHVYRGTHFSASAEQLCTQSHGGHGDEAETAIMLAIAPDTVNLGRAKPWDIKLPAGPLSRDPLAPNYSPDGIMGRPDLATAALGRELLLAMLRDLATIFVPSAPVHGHGLTCN
jgi:creatinine amidohydrolase